MLPLFTKVEAPQCVKKFQNLLDDTYLAANPLINPKIRPVVVIRLTMPSSAPMTIAAIANPLRAFGSSLAFLNAIIPSTRPIIEPKGIKNRRLKTNAVIVNPLPILSPQHVLNRRNYLIFWFLQLLELNIICVIHLFPVKFSKWNDSGILRISSWRSSRRSRESLQKSVLKGVSPFKFKK